MNSRIFTFILCLCFIVTASAQDFTLQISEMKAGFTFGLVNRDVPTQQSVSIDWGDGTLVRYSKVADQEVKLTVPSDFSKIGQPVEVKIYGGGVIQSFLYNDSNDSKTAFESFTVTDATSALNNLIITECPLKSIDVSVATKLAIIECPLTELTAVDLSANTFLEKADFADTKSLASLTIPTNSTTLTTLNLNNTALNTSMVQSIVSNAPEIVDLRLNKNLVENNKLTTINLSNNKKLEVFWITDNNLGGVLNLSENTALKDVYLDRNEIEVLNVNSELLNALRIRENKVASLNLSNVPALQFLYCSNNSLTSLDLTYQTDLKLLEAEHNLLKSIKFAPEASLTSLKLGYNCFNFATLPRMNPATYTFQGQKDSLTISLRPDRKSVDVSAFLNPVPAGEIVPGVAGQTSTLIWKRVGSSTNLKVNLHYTVSGNIVTFDEARLPADAVVYAAVDNDAYSPLTLYTIKMALFVEPGVGVDENIEDVTTLYYERTSDSVIYNFSDAESVTVYNLSGQVVYQNSLNQNNSSIDFSNLENGIYIVQIKGKNGFLTQKVAK